MVALDFSLCPDLETRSLFLSFPPSIDEGLLQKKLPQAFARLEASLKFAWFANGDQDTIRASEPKLSRLREAFLRAALAEFSSSDEALARDLEGSGKQYLALHHCPEPHIRIMKELRNMEIHLYSSSLNDSQIEISYDFDEEKQKRQITIWVTEPLTEERFNKLQNARKYSASDISALVKWFNKAQKSWGVTHLLYWAVCDYAQKLLLTYC